MRESSMVVMIDEHVGGANVALRMAAGDAWKP